MSLAPQYNTDNATPHQSSGLLADFCNRLPSLITTYSLSRDQILTKLQEIPPYEAAVADILKQEEPNHFLELLKQILEKPSTEKLIHLKRAIRQMRALEGAKGADKDSLQENINLHYDIINKILQPDGRGRQKQSPELCGNYSPDDLLKQLNEPSKAARGKDQGNKRAPSPYLTTACTGSLTLNINGANQEIPFIATPVRYLSKDLGETSSDNPEMHPMLRQFLKDACYAQLPALLKAIMSSNGHVTVFTSPSLPQADGDWDSWLYQKLPHAKPVEEGDLLKHFMSIVSGIKTAVVDKLQDSGGNQRNLQCSHQINTVSTNPLNSPDGIAWLYNNNLLTPLIRHVLHSLVYTAQEFGSILGREKQQRANAEISELINSLEKGEIPKFLSDYAQQLSEAAPKDFNKQKADSPISYDPGPTYSRYLKYLLESHLSSGPQSSDHSRMLLLTTEELVQLLRFNPQLSETTPDNGNKFVTEVLITDFEKIPWPSPKP